MSVEIANAIRYESKLRRLDIAEDFFGKVGDKVLIGPEITEEQLEVIRRSSERIVGSSKMLDLIMNFEKEVRAIETFRERHARSRAWLSEIEREEDFQKLLVRYLFKQQMFNLTENGCGKYLQIQPSYYFSVREEDGGLIVSQAGLEAFGDMANSYFRVDSTVGDGLFYLYQNLLAMEVGGWAVVVSPTEQYQKWNSTMDVINPMRVIERLADGRVIVEANYLLPGRVFNLQQRRVLHNTYQLLGYGHKPNEIDVDEIPTDRLLHDPFVERGLSEVELMLRRPSLFRSQIADVQEMVRWTNEIFEKRFGENVIKKSDMVMYGVVEKIVEENMQGLIKHLYREPDKEAYYGLLRKMLLTCQLIWLELNEEEARGLLREAGVDSQHMSVAQVRDNYLMAMQMGLIQGGFELPWGGLEEVLYGNVYGFRWDKPYGSEEMEKYCKQHDKSYTGDQCPKCKEMKQLAMV